LGEIRKKGIENHFVSLRVGLATFQPVRVDRVEDHAMLEETYSIGRTAAESINEAKRQMRPVTAVGTTVVRTLESAWAQGGIRSGTRATSLFIYPGYEFRAVDRLLTNFHLPRSTLLMMVAAFGGTGLIKKAYEEAVREKYRFYSYGDCMLIV
jgi:S-adenosylmethionine:tRNA ribosyltransferase-isomerase